MTSTHRTDATINDTRSLAETLAPLLTTACGDRLGPITWFKADWQRGGAATGTAQFTLDGGTDVPAVVKLPVGQRELRWTRAMQDENEPDPVVPRLYASGAFIGGYDLAWIVIERFAHGPLGTHWHEAHVARLGEAVARFQARAREIPVDLPPRSEPWGDLIQQAQQSVRTNELPQSQRWQKALKALRHRLDNVVSQWEQRPVHDWLHGDPHIANAMSRHGFDHGPVSLIDLAEVHAGHWVEDAVYLERQFWARPDRLKPIKPVKAVADARKRLGLEVDKDYPHLVTLRRSLLAATAPCFLKTEGNHRHLEGCLHRLETALKQLK